MIHDLSSFLALISLKLTKYQLNELQLNPQLLLFAMTMKSTTTAGPPVRSHVNKAPDLAPGSVLMDVSVKRASWGLQTDRVLSRNNVVSIIPEYLISQNFSFPPRP